MPIFQFAGRDHEGKLKTGIRMAHSPDTLSLQLMSEGVFPITIELASNTKSDWSKIKEKLFEKKVSVADLSMFSRQMYALTNTGVPIAGGLKGLAESSANSLMKKALYSMVENIEAGLDLATAMKAFPNVFTPIMISMVKVGQSSGNLAEAFLRMNQYLELEASTIKDVKTALRYPIFVGIALCLAIILINVFVIPSFSRVFASAKVDLPLPTLILMSMSNFINHYWIILTFGIIVFVSYFFYYINTPLGRLKWDHFILRIPLLGNIFKRIIMLKFAQSFAIITESGVQLIEGIELVADSVSNAYARQKILSMRELIEHGNNLTQAAAATKLFTPLELQMLSVSEETGELASLLGQMADFYKREVDYDLKRLSDIIEPLLILALSAVILIVALAVYLPIWNMVKLTKGG